MNIEQLSVITSMIDKIELDIPSSGYINVGEYEKVRVNIYPSTIIKVGIEWSMDGHMSGPAVIYRCVPCVWKCDIYEPVMPYMKIHIVNESGRPCDELIVNTWAPTAKHSVIDKIVDRASNIDKPSKSPFNVFTKKDRDIPSKIPMRDSRLPDYIPPGSILVGGEKGLVTTIPKGNLGDHLVITDRGPNYKAPGEIPWNI